LAAGRVLKLLSTLLPIGEIHPVVGKKAIDIRFIFAYNFAILRAGSGGGRRAARAAKLELAGTNQAYQSFGAACSENRQSAINH